MNKQKVSSFNEDKPLYLYNTETERCLKIGTKIGRFDTFNRELSIGDVVLEAPSLSYVVLEASSLSYYIVTDRYNTRPASCNGTITSKEIDSEVIEQAYRDWPQYYIVTEEECLKLKKLRREWSEASNEYRSKTFERIKRVGAESKSSSAEQTKFQVGDLVNTPLMRQIGNQEVLASGKIVKVYSETMYDVKLYDGTGEVKRFREKDLIELH